jgi:hypothetical protein
MTNQGWIKCSERMPAEEGFYRVRITNGRCVRQWKRGAWDFGAEVIAWRPKKLKLPAPYEGEE